MDVVDINLGAISFKASKEWMFFPYEKFILARRDSQKGILKISLAESDADPNPSPEKLLATAREFITREKLPRPFDVRKPHPGGYLFGAASYRIKEKNRDYLTRVYYFSRGKDLLFATYGCPWKAREEELVREELSQCENMILTVKFQKPS